MEEYSTTLDLLYKILKVFTPKYMEEMVELYLHQNAHLHLLVLHSHKFNQVIQEEFIIQVKPKI